MEVTTKIFGVGKSRANRIDSITKKYGGKFEELSTKIGYGNPISLAKQAGLDESQLVMLTAGMGGNTGGNF